MMTFVNMDAEGLVILPTHRVVHGLSGFVAGDFFERAGNYFEVEAVATEGPAVLMERLKSEQGRTAFLAVTRYGARLLRTKPGVAEEVLADISERQRQLDVVQLHALVLERLLGITSEAIREQTHVRYLRDAGEAVEQVLRGEANAGFLMNPVALDQLREVAFAGEVLPQKSTDFFPKLLSGLAIYALD